MRYEAEEGAGTVIALVIVAVLGLVLAIMYGVNTSARARYQAQTTADMAVLGAVNHLYLHASKEKDVDVEKAACHQAALVALRNNARLHSCRVLWQEKPVNIEVAVQVGSLFGTAVERAKAGPVS